MSDNVKGTFYGKYRGLVTNNQDPFFKMRIKAQVPEVLGLEETAWALPCSPYAGINEGMFFLPPVGSNVWIEFEKGNPALPIWVGGFWGEFDIPPTLKSPTTPKNKTIKTQFCEMSLDDNVPPGEITLKLAMGTKITIKGMQIELNNNIVNIKLTPASVSINGQNLVVLP
ncbi:MAG: phage baseplate assembly protein V [Candidatus Nitrosocosmicus sp.]